jgi:hypothetical protein
MDFVTETSFAFPWPLCPHVCALTCLNQARFLLQKDHYRKRMYQNIPLFYPLKLDSSFEVWGSGGGGGHRSKPRLCHVNVVKLAYMSSNRHRPLLLQSGTCLAQVSL